jgi:hypothetical protein
LWIIEPIFGKNGDYSRLQGNAGIVWKKNCGYR